MRKTIRKAVFPVAGLGTRFLPATKASPKEMLPVVDKPLIQYAAEEAISAGIEVLIFVTGRSKQAIENHFDKAYELESELMKSKRIAEVEQLQKMVPSSVSCVYVRQPEALGLGHAVGCAESIVGDEPFAVILADDLIDAPQGCLTQMVEQYESCQSSILGVQQIPREHSKRYGVIAASPVAPRLHQLSKIVEKPTPEEAPSNLGVVGRYILTPQIFKELHTITAGKGGELQLTDAIAQLMDSEKVFAYEFEGARYDCGDKLGYLKATVELALKHPELKESFSSYLDRLFSMRGA
jgi:UTP--glucose-1-phosphate uridylyltransferase